MEKKRFGLYCFDSWSYRIVESKSVSVPPPARIKVPPPFVASVVQLCCVLCRCDVDFCEVRSHYPFWYCMIVERWCQLCGRFVTTLPCILPGLTLLDWLILGESIWCCPSCNLPVVEEFSVDSFFNMGRYADNVAGCNLGRLSRCILPIISTDGDF